MAKALSYWAESTCKKIHNEMKMLPRDTTHISSEFTLKAKQTSLWKNAGKDYERTIFVTVNAVHLVVCKIL